MIKKLARQVIERDGGVCQLCGHPASDLHHIAYGGMGRKRKDLAENLISLCRQCHNDAHSKAKTRRRCEDWSRKKYGSKIDELVKEKWTAWN